MKAFVLMPFNQNFDDVYNLGIKAAAKDRGITANRLDDQIFATDMLNRIYDEIDNSDFIIADMSERNANVFYEVGYCDAKKKTVILLTNNADDIPFDFLHRPHIIYSNVTELKNELNKKLDWVRKEIRSLEKEPLFPSISKITSFLERSDYSDTAVVNLRLEIHNRTDFNIEKINSIYIYTGESWNLIYNNESCQHTDSDIDPYMNRHIIHQNFNSIPGNDWLPIDIEMKKKVYSKWDDEEQQDEYVLEGAIKISINTDKKKFIYEEKIRTTHKYFDIPF